MCTRARVGADAQVAPEGHVRSHIHVHTHHTRAEPNAPIQSCAHTAAHLYTCVQTHTDGRTWHSSPVCLGMPLRLSLLRAEAPPRSAMSSEPPPPAQPPTHQASVGLLDTQQARDRSPSPLRGHVVPSPLPTRRTRTFSATVRASQGPVYKGVCKCFCRSKGHGFITPADGGPDIFLHISDVEGEYVPVEGDEVTYKMCSIPPKNEKLQAVEVVITHLAPGTKHETWSGHVVSS
uniref:Calcium regulated heat stable protein 1 n=1 Tax=Equus caballus TaxID=9796 RepID=A0A9L0S6S5_HORSE